MAGDRSTADKLCAEYLKSWSFAEAIRRRLQNYTGGIFKLDTRRGFIALEIGGIPQAAVDIRENASADVFRCFCAFVDMEIEA